MPESEEPDKISFRVFYIAGLALLVRLFYLSEHAASPLFSHPVLDALYYDTVADLLARGESLAEINPGFRPLLYPWLLSRLHLLTPTHAVPLAIVFQHLLGVATTIVLMRIAFRLSGSNRIAAVAGLLFVLAGPPLYFEGEILLTSLTTFLCTVLVEYMVRQLGRPAIATELRTFLPWLVAGLLLGLAAQTRPNVLLFALAIPFGATQWARKNGLKTKLQPTALAALGVFLTLTLFGVFQQSAFGRFQLLPGAGGVNFYLGNKQGADGMIPRQDRTVTYADGYRDSVQVFARQEYERDHARTGPRIKTATAREISRYWLGRGLDEIARAPREWSGLMARKTLFLLWNREIPNNRSYAWVSRHESRMLSRLPVRWWVLLCLAPLGALGLWRRASPLGVFWVASFLTFWGGGLVLFFVNGRYRAPMWPLMCVLAGAGAVHLVDAATAAWRRRSPQTFLRPTVGVALLACVSLVNWLRIPPPPEGRDFFYRSVANLELGRLEPAEADARQAVKFESQEAMHHFQLASVHLARDQPGQAEAALRVAARLTPDEPRVWNNLGVALEGSGRAGEAYDSYLQAINRLPDYAPALTNAALLELRGGQTAAAAAHLQEAAAAGDDSVHFLCASAFLARSEGRHQEATQLLEEASARNVETTRRLEEENRVAARLVAP
ncbi:MAG: hypothetical protein OES47_12870 [Acidobacteriota bacterium]|nr:hypothetical protein [Acidobacteriota bacterium]